MKVKVILEHKLKEKIMSTNAKSIEELLKEINIDIENYVVIKNGRVVTDLSEKIKNGDEIRIIEAVGGG